MFPYDLEMESAVLGSMIMVSSCIDVVLPILDPESFYKEEHQVIFRAITSMVTAGKPVDLLTLSAFLRKDVKSKSHIEPSYLAELTSRISSTSHIKEHAYAVQYTYKLRQLIQTGSEMVSKAYDWEDAKEIISTVQSSFDQILNENQPGKSEHIIDLIRRRIPEIERMAKNKKELIGIPTGLHDLDRATGGWQNSDLIIIAGRPSQGKTAFGLYSAIVATQAGHPTAVFSLEMSKPQLVDRAISSVTSLSPLDIRKGAMDWTDLEHGIAKLEKLPLYIDDTSTLNMAQLRSKIQNLKKYGIGLVIVDYLQLLSGEGIIREQVISSISRSLKAIAKDMNIPIIALSQLNRQADGKRPVLANLRESGAIEQDADIVIFLHRPEMYGIDTTDKGESTRGLCEVIVDKHRNGPTGLIKCYTNEYCTKFTERST